MKEVSMLQNHLNNNLNLKMTPNFPPRKKKQTSMKSRGQGRRNEEKEGETGREGATTGETGTERRKGGDGGKRIQGAEPEAPVPDRGRAFDSMSYRFVDNVARSSEFRVCASTTGAAHVCRGCPQAHADRARARCRDPERRCCTSC